MSMSKEWFFVEENSHPAPNLFRPGFSAFCPWEFSGKVQKTPGENLGHDSLDFREEK